MAEAGKESIETRRKRLTYRSAHRGMKESDLLLGAFAAAHLGTFTPTQLDEFEALIEESDKDLMSWIFDSVAPPDRMTEVLRMLLAFRYPGPG